LTFVRHPIPAAGRPSRSRPVRAPAVGITAKDTLTPRPRQGHSNNANRSAAGYLTQTVRRLAIYASGKNHEKIS